MNHFWFDNGVLFAQSFSGMHCAKRGAAALFSCVSLLAKKQHRHVDSNYLFYNSRRCALLNSFSQKPAMRIRLPPSPHTSLNARCTMLSATQCFLMFSSQPVIFGFILHVCFSSQTCQHVPFSTTYHNRSLWKWQKMLRKKKWYPRVKLQCHIPNKSCLDWLTYF